MRKTLCITVKLIKGICPVYKEGQKFFISQGYILDSNNEKICMHSLSSLMPFYSILSLHEINPESIGLGKNNYAYIQCPDPCEFTNGGTVLFEIKKE